MLELIARIHPDKLDAESLLDVFELSIRPQEKDFQLPGRWLPIYHTGLREVPLDQAFDEVLGPWLIYQAHNYQGLVELFRPYFQTEEGGQIPMPARQPNPGVCYVECRRYRQEETVYGYVTLQLVPKWVETSEEELANCGT